MNIHGIHPQGITVNTVNKINPCFTSNEMKPDTFVRTNTFNLEDAVKELTEMKGLKDKPKFKEETITILSEELKNAPEKWEPLKQIAARPDFINSIVVGIMKKSSEDVKVLAEISSLTKPDNQESKKFSSLEIKKISEALSGKDLQKIEPLSDCNIGIDNIIQIASNPKITDIKTVVAKTQAMEKACGDDLLSLTFNKDSFDSDAFAIIGELRSGGKKIELLDGNFKTRALEEVKLQTSESGKKYQIRKVKDFTNNTTSKVTSEITPRLPQPIFKSEVRLVKDKNNNIIRKEYTIPSEVPGILNIKHVDSKGKESIISSGIVDKPSGIVSVNKHMTSIDGTKTEYLYEDDPNGNKIQYYTVTDKNGQILLDNNNSFEVLSEHKFISTKNGNKYEINVSDKSIEINDVNKNENHKIEFENYIDGNTEKLLKSLKQLPGEELIAVSKSVKKLNGIDDINYSTFGCESKTIKTGDNLFVLLHELGHAKDYKDFDIQNEKETLKSLISADEEFGKVYAEEKAAFNKAFPHAQREHIQYFIKNNDESTAGKEEVVAESNAILSTHNSDDLFSIRSQYLQQFFPKTIVHLSKVLEG